MKPICSVAIVCLSLMITAGCRGGEAPSQEGAPAGGAARVPVPTHEHMQAHFDAIVAVRDAVIDGNLDGARSQARWIVENKTEPGIASWREYIDEIQRWAADVVNASAMDPAAAAGAELARTCGRCHSGHAVPPDLGAPALTPPATGTDPVAHMRQHQWAAERMWEGLIGPSESRWNAGTAELARAPLTSEEILSDPSAAKDINDLTARVRALAAEARDIPATAWDTRSAIYGRFLSTCAACHQAIRPTRQERMSGVKPGFSPSSERAPHDSEPAGR